MSPHYIRDSPWPPGVTVSAYKGSQGPVGVPSSQAVTGWDGSIEFRGLELGETYVGVGSGCEAWFVADGGRHPAPGPFTRRRAFELHVDRRSV